jgi:hypothetical protein
MTDEGDGKDTDEAAQIRLALQQTAGNIAWATRFLRISRVALRHRMARYGMAQPSKGRRVVVPSPQQTEERPEATAGRHNGQRVVPLRKVLVIL